MGEVILTAEQQAESERIEDRVRAGASAEIRPPARLLFSEARRPLLGYFRNNLHRVGHPRYVFPGWPTGSGMVEAACKTVVCQRLQESACAGETPAPPPDANSEPSARANPNSEKLWEPHPGPVIPTFLMHA